MGSKAIERIKERLFPEEKMIDPKKGSFSALPFILRKWQFRFEPRTWQVYTYIIMRTGQEGITWFDLKEMSFDLEYKSVSKLKPYVNKLVEEGWIRTATNSGKDYYAVRNPLVVIGEIWADTKKRATVKPDRWNDLNDLLAKLNLPIFEAAEE